MSRIELAPSPADLLESHRGVALTHGCRRERLPGWLARRFVRLAPDAATCAWIDGALHHPHSRTRTRMRKALVGVVSEYDANGLLGMHDMWVLGRAQWGALLGREEGAPGRLLDLGAGDGAVTAELAAVFDDVTTTELSRPMARRLRRRGWKCHKVDIAQATLPDTEPFDAVSLLNVIDRTSHPHTLLEHARALAAPGGRVIVAVPLPLDPCVHVGPTTVDPDEPLPLDHRSWEAAAGTLAEELLAALGLEVTALARTPYLSRGDVAHPIHTLDDAIFVCRTPGG